MYLVDVMLKIRKDEEDAFVRFQYSLGCIDIQNEGSIY